MSNLFEDIRHGVKNWWWFLVLGLLFVAAGIAVFAWPASAYISLSLLFSILMICSGISQILFSASNRSILRGWGWILVSGIIDLVLGTYLFFNPFVTMATLPYFIGFWLIIRSFYIMGASLDLHAFGVKDWGWLFFGGIMVLILGAVIVYYPPAGVVSIIGVSGFALVFGGIANVYLAFQLKNIKTEVSKVLAKTKN